MSAQLNIPFGLRTQFDKLPPQDLARELLDRDISEIDRCFSAALEPGYALTVVASDIAYRTGRLAILDVGCGTLNSARSLSEEVGRQVSPYVPKILGNLSVKGVSLHDYSRESMHTKTEWKAQPEIYDYLVADAADMKEVVPDNYADFTYSFAAMMYADDPAAWLQEMVRATRPRGIIEFNATDSQVASGGLLHKHLEVMQHELGYDIVTGRCDIYAPGGSKMIDHYFYIGVPVDKKMPKIDSGMQQSALGS